MKVYADNAATTKVSESVMGAMIPFFTKQYGNPSSMHTFGQVAAQELLKARETIAAILNANPNEIYFTSGGSEADTQAIISAAISGAAVGKKHIISSKFEHHAVLHTLDKLVKQGFDITLLDVNENGIVRVHDVEAAIRTDTALVTIMFANNEIGTVQPISDIGALCQERGVLFHTDAVQAVGHLPVDVKAMNIDMLSLSAHKFHGPKGIGALYAKNGVALSSIIEGGQQERGRRAGTENIPGIVGLAAALSEVTDNMGKNTEYTIVQRNKLIQGLEAIPGSRLNGDRHIRVPGTVNFSFKGVEGESLLLMLNMKGIAASSGSACTSGSLDPSHVLSSLGLPIEYVRGSLRLSIDEYNTPDEIDYLIKIVSDVVEALRKISQ